MGISGETEPAYNRRHWNVKWRRIIEKPSPLEEGVALSWLSHQNLV